MVDRVRSTDDSRNIGDTAEAPTELRVREDIEDFAPTMREGATVGVIDPALTTAAPASLAVPPGNNQVPNGDFENLDLGVTGWRAGTNTTVAHETGAVGQDGAGCLKMTTTAAATTATAIFGRALDTDPGDIPVQPGEGWAVTADVGFGSAGRVSLSLMLGFTDDAGADVGGSIINSAMPDNLSWETQVVAAGTVPPGATRMYVKYIAGLSGSAKTFYLDNVYVARTANLVGALTTAPAGSRVSVQGNQLLLYSGGPTEVLPGVVSGAIDRGGSPASDQPELYLSAPRADATDLDVYMRLRQQDQSATKPAVIEFKGAEILSKQGFTNMGSQHASLTDTAYSTTTEALWGGTEITVMSDWQTNPICSVMVTVCGYFTNTGATANQMRLRVGISFDGGSTWSDGPQVICSNVGNAAGALSRAPIAVTFSASGAPTGSILARARVQNNTGTATVTAQGGTLDALVIPS